MVLRPKDNSLVSELDALALVRKDGSCRLKVGNDRCCRGIENLELWGPVVNLDFKFNSSKECCRACKEMCVGMVGHFCVILGCCVGIETFAGQNSMR